MCNGVLKNNKACNFKGIYDGACWRHRDTSLEDCCICLDECKFEKVKYAYHVPNIVKCDTCKVPMHKTCVVELINSCEQYDKCPHCRSSLPKEFQNYIEDRILEYQTRVNEENIRVRNERAFNYTILTRTINEEEDTIVLTFNSNQIVTLSLYLYNQIRA